MYRIRTMNSFYILLYLYVYKNNAIFEYLDSNKEHTTQSLTTLIDAQQKEINIITILFNNMFYKHGVGEKITLLRRLKLRLKIRETHYQLFNTVVQSNTFLSDEIKEKCIELFGKIRKTYAIFSRLAYLWKWKRSQIPIINDLFFNEIDIIKPYNYILYQNGVRYYFRISDLLRSIEQKLIHYDTHNFEMMPEKPINPYTKIELSICDLYNIYFHISRSSMKIPLFFQMYFDEQFNFTVFTTKNETYLQKIALRNYVFNEPNTSKKLYSAVREMIEENPFTKRMKIHDDFPQTKLVDTFRNYVYIKYLIDHGNLECNVEFYYKNMLFIALKVFAQRNPIFGRKIIKKKQSSEKPFMLCYPKSDNPTKESPKSEKTYYFHETIDYIFNSLNI